MSFLDRYKNIQPTTEYDTKIEVKYWPGFPLTIAIVQEGVVFSIPHDIAIGIEEKLIALDYKGYLNYRFLKGNLVEVILEGTVSESLWKAG